MKIKLVKTLGGYDVVISVTEEDAKRQNHSVFGEAMDVYDTLKSGITVNHPGTSSTSEELYYNLG